MTVEHRRHSQRTAAPIAIEMLDRASAVWDSLLRHPVPQAMAEASFPAENFRYYLSQNIVYLGDYTRALALGLARSTNPGTLESFSVAIDGIVNDEIPTNRRLWTAIDLLCSQPAALEQPKAPANVAYTSWLLATAYSGGEAEILAAVMPCAWSYGEIARRLADDLAPHPVYQPWMTFFAGDDYRAKIDVQLERLNELAEASSPSGRANLSELFLTGCRMEYQFWTMAQHRTTWPDLTGLTP
jgi:thiaminase/transcriptional activator TenA